ncbi:MAG: helix-turn-helix domain-containing protein [Candidatus Sericytochromatia bacterium]|nr:helix-turn-helix domain-containing protein [Candidatus Tanganyikabacteria bacterium]
MQLSVRDLAEALGLPSATVYRWLKTRGLPGVTVQDEVRFNRVDVLEWSLRRGFGLVRDLFAGEDEDQHMTAPVAEALARGGTRPIPGGPLGPEVADSLAAALPEVPAAHLASLLPALRAGRAPGWQPVPQGPVIIPRPRHPLVCPLSAPSLVVVYPSRGVALPASFGPELIRAWIWILSPTPRAHLALLERLGRMLIRQGLADLLAAQVSPERLHAEIAFREEAA